MDFSDISRLAGKPNGNHQQVFLSRMIRPKRNPLKTQDVKRKDISFTFYVCFANTNINQPTASLGESRVRPALRDRRMRPEHAHVRARDLSHQQRPQSQ